MSEPLENLWLSYSRQTDEKKRILLKLLSPNLFYDGSKVVITINRVLETLFKFIVFKNGADSGTMSEPKTNIKIDSHFHDSSSGTFFIPFIEHLKSNFMAILENDVKICMQNLTA